MGWAIYWAIFSQTNLVTLPSTVDTCTKNIARRPRRPFVLGADFLIFKILSTKKWTKLAILTQIAAI
jgi:hypothetical protein